MRPINILALLLLSSFVVSSYSCHQTTIDLEESISTRTCCLINTFGSRVADVSLPIISLQQTSCYGQCPVYTIKIYADGTAVLEGLRNVSLLGTHKTTVSDAFIQTIQCRAFESGYFSMADRYPQALIPIADAPSVIMHITTCNRVKTITKTGFAPEALRIFEHWMIDELMSLPWAVGGKKTPTQNLMHRLNHVIDQ